MARKKSPKVSVLMPFYDNGTRENRKYFSGALRSILGQTFQDFEVVVVASGERKFVEGLSAKNGKVRLFFFDQPVRRGPGLPLKEKLHGLITARNICIKKARGKYVAFQDFDDESTPERLETQAGFLDSHPEVGAVGSCMTLIDSEGNEKGFRGSIETDAEIRRHMLQFNPVPQPALMARRRLIVRAGAYRPDEIPEDFDLWVRMAAFTKFHNLQLPLVRYRVHHGGGASNYKRELFTGSLRVKMRAARALRLRPTLEDAAVNLAQAASLLFPNSIRRILFERVRSSLITRSGRKKHG